MEQKLIGKICKIYTTKGYFYRGEIIDEDDTHIIISDFKSGRDIMLSRESISELITAQESL